MKNLFKNMDISRILALSYTLVIALFAISIAIATFAIRQNAVTTYEFYDGPYQVSKSALTLRGTLVDTSAKVSILLNEEDSPAIVSNIAAIDDLVNQREAHLDILFQAPYVSNDMLGLFQQANDALISEKDRIVTAVSNNEYSRAKELYETSYLPQLDETLDLADQIVAEAETVASNFITDTVELENTTYVIVAIVALVIVAFMLITWRLVSKGIATPVAALEQTSERLVQGDLATTIDYQSNSELGRLASSLDTTIVSIRGYIKEIDRVLSLLGQGKLYAKPNVTFVGDYAAIGTSLERVASSLRKTVDRLSEAAEQVERSSAQMSDGSQSIAQGSAEQAMAIEELATNLQNIERMVDENTENVLKADRGTVEVLSAVADGSDQIAHTAHVIGQIKDNTQNIAQLANTIEDISFQTNILALNASVEAARAGMAGRGFSIVADEIRRLAAQISEASQAADELASNTIANIATGNAMIDTAATNMSGAVRATENVKEMMSSVSLASQQQLEAVAQIRESMDRLSDVVQENSASAEESAVIAEELTSQASDLKSLIEQFELDPVQHDENGR